MSLNPSCNNVDGTSLPVLGDPPFSARDVEIAKAELLRAAPDAVFNIQETTRQVCRRGSIADQTARCGIVSHHEGREDDIETETVYRVEANILGWKFRRLWYYWSCSTSERPIPGIAAAEFNEVFGSQVRVDGYSGGYFVTGAVSLYHVDTMDGLIALVTLIREAPVKEPQTNQELR